MEKVLIGILGEDDDAIDVLLQSFEEFYPTIISVLVKKGFEKKVVELKKEIKRFPIEVEEVIVSEFLELEEVFLNISELTQKYSGDSIVINVDCDYMSSCLALSSAFVNGILALGILGEKLISYPIMKFSYADALNEKKRELLSIINEKGEISSMEELAKLSKMSLPLIAYHLRGNRDAKGLVEMNLVILNKGKGSVKVSLTELGRLIVNNGISTMPSCHVDVKKLKRAKSKR